MTTFANLASTARSALIVVNDGVQSFSVDKVTDVTLSIGNRGRALDADIHAAAYACLHFAMPKGVSASGAGNCEPARFLVASMSKGLRQKSLVDWFAAHSNIRLRQDKKTGAWACGLAKNDAATFVEADELMALAAKAWGMPFFTPEEKTSGAKAFDLGAAMAALLARAAKELGENDPKVTFLADWAKANAPAPAKAKKAA